MKKNIFLLVLDGMRPDRMSCNGNKRKTTPFIDSLVKRGRYFTNAYSVGHCSLPCHISIFTGVHPYFHKAGCNLSYYNNNLPYLTDELKKAGYTTSGISTKNPYLSVECGFIRHFDRYFKVIKSNTSRSKKTKQILKTTSQRFKFLRGGMFESLKDVYKKREREKLFDQLSKFYLYNDLGGKKITSLLKGEFDKLHKQGEPFFLFGNILEAHTPFLPPLPYRNYFGQVKLTKSLLTAFFDPHSFIEGRVSFTQEEQEGLEILYDSGLRYMDDLVSNLFEYLDHKNYLKDSLIIIMSDHSEMLNEHDRLIGHGNGTYEGMIKVPILAIDGSDPQFKGREDKGCSIIDVFPTILESAGIKLNHNRFPYKCFNLKDLPGHRPIIAESTKIAFPERLYNFPNMMLNFSHVERTIILNQKKMIWRSDGDHRLFDLATDRGEENNIFDQNKNQLAINLMNLMDKWYREQLKNDEFFSLEYFTFNGKPMHIDQPSDLSITQDISAITHVQDEMNNLRS